MDWNAWYLIHTFHLSHLVPQIPQFFLINRTSTSARAGNSNSILIYTTVSLSKPQAWQFSLSWILLRKNGFTIHFSKQSDCRSNKVGAISRGRSDPLVLWSLQVASLDCTVQLGYPQWCPPLKYRRNLAWSWVSRDKFTSCRILLEDGKKHLNIHFQEAGVDFDMLFSFDGDQEPSRLMPDYCSLITKSVHRLLLPAFATLFTNSACISSALLWIRIGGTISNPKTKGVSHLHRTHLPLNSRILNPTNAIFNALLSLLHVFRKRLTDNQWKYQGNIRTNFDGLGINPYLAPANSTPHLDSTCTGITPITFPSCIRKRRVIGNIRLRGWSDR